MVVESPDYTKATVRSVLVNDLEEVWRKDVEYNRSWKMRGGVGAFMMLARKWDRLENQLKRDDAPTSADGARAPAKYDIFEHIEADPRAESVIDDIRDLRRYLLLVETEMIARGVIQIPPAANVTPLHQPQTKATIREEPI